MQAHTLPASRTLSQFVADIAQSITELELDEISNEQSLSRSSSSTQLCHVRHMAGSASHTMLQQRKLGQSRLRPLSAGTGRRRKPSSVKITNNRTLKEVFGTFASGRERMYWKDFDKLCRSSLLFDGHFMVPEARCIFNGLLCTGHRSIDFERFEQLLSDVAFERQCTLDLVHQLVRQCEKHEG